MNLRPLLAVPALLLASVLTPTAVPAAATAPLAPACAAGEVEVVVDFGDLGGGVQHRCGAADGTGQDVLEDAGFALDPVQRHPAFVCRVDGVPADDPCVNTPPGHAYWGVWWSADADDPWAYATVGASGLTVPAGGRVGLAWQSGTRREPGADGPVPADTAPEDAPEDAAKSPEADEGGDQDEALPTGLVAGVFGVLVAVGAAVAVVRRRAEER